MRVASKSQGSSNRKGCIMNSISRRTFLAGTGTAILGVLLAGCSSSGSSSDAGSSSSKANKIYVLTASEDHGWTGSVATFAKQKVEEINNAGTYSAELVTSASASDQITHIEDILAGDTSSIAGIVIQPMDDTVQSAIQSIINADIPFVAFDRIIDSVSSSAVSNVKGDNEGIGAAAASWFVENGLKPGDKIYVYEGDTSSVTTLRDKGMTEYLTGALKCDDEAVADASKWTEAQLSSITYSGAMNWSRSNTKTAFESLMGDASNASTKWFYCEDDEFAMGLLEALSGGGISESTKSTLLANKPFITGCGGLDELYEVLRGNSDQDLMKQLGGLMSVTYSPSMIEIAIQDMVDHLDGKTVEQDHVIACEKVTRENVANFESFK